MSRNIPKSKLSLKRKAGAKNADPTRQKLSTKQLVAPKLKVPSAKSERRLETAGDTKADHLTRRSTRNEEAGDPVKEGKGGVEEAKCFTSIVDHGHDEGFSVESMREWGEGDVELGVTEAGKDGHVFKGGMSGGATSLDGVENENLGELFFCHICQKDLTKFDLARRQTHINRCCDDELKAKPSESQEHVCVLCKKTFHNEMVKTQHMKSCAKSKGLSTAQLIAKVRGEEPPKVSANGARQLSLRSVVQKRADEDFKQPPPARAKKRKRKMDTRLNSVGGEEYEQLQLALAMSASLAGSNVAGGGGLLTSAASEVPRSTLPGRRRKRKRADPAHLPLLSASSQQCRERIAQRAEQILMPASTEEGTESDEPMLTQAFARSELAMGRVIDSPPTSIQSARESDGDDLFVSDGETVSYDNGLGGQCLAPCGEGGGGAQGSGSDGAREELCRRSESGEGKGVQGRTGLTEEPTLWRLGSEDFSTRGYSEFYVPALSSTISPRKTDPLYCKQCDSSSCLGTLPPSIPTSESKDQQAVRDSDSSTQKPHPSLASDLRSMINSSLLSDLTILVGKGSATTDHCGDSQAGSLRAHRCLLVARWQMFRQVLEERHPLPNTLDLSEYNRQTVLAFLELVYTGTCPSPAMEQVNAIVERMSSLEEVKKIVSYVTNTSSKSCQTTTASATSPAASTPASITDPMHVLSDHSEEDCNEITCVNTSNLSNNTRRQSRALFSESPSPVATSVLPHTGDTVTVLASPDRDHTSAPDIDTRPLPVVLSPASPVLVVSTSNSSVSPVPVEQDISRNLSKEQSSNTKFDNEIGTEDSEEVMEESFDIPLTPSYMSSCSPPPVLTQHSTWAGNPGDDQRPVSSPRSSSSSDLVLCGVSYTQEVQQENSDGDGGVARSGKDSELDGTDESLSEAASSPMFFVEGSDGSVIERTEMADIGMVEVEEEEEEVVAVEEFEESETIKMGRKEMAHRDTTKENTMNNSNTSQPAAAENEDLFYINDQFEADWLMNMTDYNPAVQDGGPKRMSASQPSLLNRSAKTPGVTDLNSLSQTPVSLGCNGIPSVTPAAGGRWSIISDDNITPMPRYHTMATPHLRKEGNKFGLKGLPKRKMIAKLVEIYNYTHPLVAEDGTIVPEDPGSGDEETLRLRVKHAITSDNKLYQDILLYQPLELSFIQEKLKSSGINLAKEKLMDILDFMCVTFTEPRDASRKKQSKPKENR